MSFLAKTCLEAFNKKSAVTCPKMLTLTRITNSYWHNTFFWKNCLAMLIGDTDVIEQHISEASCINIMDSKLKLKICLLNELSYEKTHIIYKQCCIALCSMKSRDKAILCQINICMQEEPPKQNMAWIEEFFSWITVSFYEIFRVVQIFWNL